MTQQSAISRTSWFARTFTEQAWGRALFEQVLQRYEHVRQTVLITDDEPQQRALYESMGLTEGADFSVGPVRVFAKFR